MLSNSLRVLRCRTKHGTLGVALSGKEPPSMRLLPLWPAGDPPIDVAMQMTIVYYHQGGTVRLDRDNFVKPIQDALNGRIYVDDRLITDARIRKTSLNGSFEVRGMRQVLANAFVKGVPFVHVRIEEAPSHEDSM